MLKIYTSSELAQKMSYTVEWNIDAMFNNRTENMKKQYSDNISIKILEQIEGMTNRDEDRIDGKFGNVSLYDISTGGKGCLLAVNYKDFIIDAIQLGENCLKLLLNLAENQDIVIMYNEPLYIFEGYTVSVDGEELNGYEASKAIEDAYYANYVWEET